MEGCNVYNNLSSASFALQPLVNHLLALCPHLFNFVSSSLKYRVSNFYPVPMFHFFPFLITFVSKLLYYQKIKYMPKITGTYALTFLTTIYEKKATSIYSQWIIDCLLQFWQKYVPPANCTLQSAHCTFHNENCTSNCTSNWTANRTANWTLNCTTNCTASVTFESGSRHSKSRFVCAVKT